MKKLEWFVFVEDINTRSIKYYNVLNDNIVQEIVDRTRGIESVVEFDKELTKILMYNYWSRSEWEIILTSWPAFITKEELDRLVADAEEHRAIYGNYPYRCTPSLDIAMKVDVWQQIVLNWKHFLGYVWKELGPSA